MSAFDAVLLVAFGGPTASDEIRPFLERVAQGRRIPPERLLEVARHYERMPGGRSPLNELTFAQARALEAELAAGGPALPVFVGMRNWHPFLHDTLDAMADKGLTRAVGGRQPRDPPADDHQSHRPVLRTRSASMAMNAG